MSAEFTDRLQLFDQLAALPSDRFEALLFALPIPRGLIGGAVAPQRSRVGDLLNWADGLTGCGLEKLKSVLEQVLTGEFNVEQLTHLFQPYLQSFENHV